MSTTDRFGFDIHDGETDDQYFQSRGEFYCKQGNYVGSPGGADYMCHWCEEGVSDAEYKRAKQYEAKQREEARHVRLDLDSEALGNSLSVGAAYRWFVKWVPQGKMKEATIEYLGQTFPFFKGAGISDGLAQPCTRVVTDYVNGELVDMKLWSTTAVGDDPIHLHWQLAE